MNRGAARQTSAYTAGVVVAVIAIAVVALVLVVDARALAPRRVRHPPPRAPSRVLTVELAGRDDAGAHSRTGPTR